jgi:hypothetical protein
MSSKKEIADEYDDERAQKHKNRNAVDTVHVTHPL